jgi:hypothetical protein
MIVPLVFVVSQRTDKIITPKETEFRKEDCVLKIGGFEDTQGEGCQPKISMRKLFHLETLD